MKRAIIVPPVKTPARIEYMKVGNFRALHDVELKELTPLTVLIGPNGSGKSTLFDVFAFLSECFTHGLRAAWDKRGRFKELLSRNADGPILIEIKYREEGFPLIAYHLEIGETRRGPVVEREWLRWKRQHPGAPYRFLDFAHGKGWAIQGDKPDRDAERDDETLAKPEMLAVNSLGQFEKHPRVRALRDFITGWHLSYLSAQDTRGTPESGPQEHLSKSGDNLANVVQYLLEQYPDHLDDLLDILGNRVPRLEKVGAEIMQDGRLLLQIKDAPFERPILSRFASDGTMKMLSYLILIHDPNPFPMIGIEEPENFLHPRLLPELAEECREATDQTQLLITTHSPYFLNAVTAHEVRVLHRDQDGYTRIKRPADIEGTQEMMAAGAKLGDLWMEGYFGIGNPGDL